jgi:hypothetical protein
MDDFDDRVKQRAYRLWVEEGCPEGRSEIHWDKARELVAVEENQTLATKPARSPGEFPTLRNHGERSAPARHSVAAARAPAKRKASEPKPSKDTGKRR